MKLKTATRSQQSDSLADIYHSVTYTPSLSKNSDNGLGLSCVKSKK